MSLLGPDGRRLELQLQPVYVADDLLTLRSAALAGTGMALLPDFMVRGALADGRLQQVLPGWAPPPGVVHAVFPSRRGLAPAVRRLLDFLGEHVTDDSLQGCPAQAQCN
jgi:DNA-binding transcriptional LysR family regulator